MTQIWKADKVFPVTEIEAGPVFVTQIRNREKDGYSGVQLGFGLKKKPNKPLAGHLKGMGNSRYLREFRIADDSSFDKKKGEKLDVSQFKEGEKVKVSGVSKGRGFQGVVKRHGFKGGPKTHGQKNRHRAPGSIGATAPQRVVPGLRMAGRMGGNRVTVKNLTIIEINKEKNLLFLKGAVPGKEGSILEIRS